MNKKIAIIFVILVCILQFVLLGYFNYMYVTNDVYTYQGNHYPWWLIIRVGLDEVVVLSVGFILYFKDVILTRKSLWISSAILLVSVVLLWISGLIFVLTFESYLASPLNTMFNQYLNTFFIIYAAAYVVFTIAIFKSKLVTFLPKLLLILLFSGIVTRYIYGNLLFGWLSNPYRIPTRYLWSTIVMYPLYISMFVVAALYLFEQYKDRQESLIE